MTISQKDQAMFHIKRQRKRKPRALHAIRQADGRERVRQAQARPVHAAHVAVNAPLKPCDTSAE